MTKPSLKEMKRNYRDYILELANGERAILVDADGEIKVLELYEADRTPTFWDTYVDTLDGLYDDEYSDYKIIKIYMVENEREYLYHILTANSDIKWDWTKSQPVEMTLSEVCKALGKDIKIIKE
jgi:hypothetical protein